MAHRPAAEWALLPLLLGEAQACYWRLDVASKMCVEPSWTYLSSHWQQFCGSGMGVKDQTFAFAPRLHDAAVRWLQPGPSPEEAQLLDAVVQEQFVEGFPGETAQCVSCHRPASLHAAVTLAEDHVAARPEEAVQPAAESRPVPAPRRFPTSAIALEAAGQSSSRLRPWDANSVSLAGLSKCPGSCRRCAPPTGNHTNARAGVLEVQATRIHQLRVPTDGGGSGVLCHWPSNTFPRSEMGRIA